MFSLTEVYLVDHLQMMHVTDDVTFKHMFWKCQEVKYFHRGKFALLYRVQIREKIFHAPIVIIIL